VNETIKHSFIFKTQNW